MRQLEHTAIMRQIIKLLIIVGCLAVLPTDGFPQTGTSEPHPVEALLGERLVYDISFLWFDHLAEGEIELSAGERAGTYLIVMQARTLGVAAFFTRNRIEKYQTLMEVGPGGILRPLWHSSHSIRGEGASRKEKSSKYTFDYTTGQVRYQKVKNDRVYSDIWLAMEEGRQQFDILSALYNLRLGLFGLPDQGTIEIPTFHRKGPQDIVVEPLQGADQKDISFFGKAPFVCRILVDPSVFGTSGRDIFASFDHMMRPQRGIIKNVIGLGDVRGVMRGF